MREKGFKQISHIRCSKYRRCRCVGNNPIYENGSVIGRATGGDYGFRLEKSIALGMVKPELANVGQKLKIEILEKNMRRQF